MLAAGRGQRQQQQAILSRPCNLLFVSVSVVLRRQRTMPGPVSPGARSKRPPRASKTWRPPRRLRRTGGTSTDGKGRLRRSLVSRQQAQKPKPHCSYSEVAGVVFQAAFV